jgi:Carboxypeptidase regulatory-like domain
MRTLVVALTGIVLSVNMFAQGRSQINGTVLDASGGAVPGASVKVTNTDTALVRTVESASDGTYAVPDLPVGPYRVDVSKQGFATAVQTGIVLQVVSNPTVNVTLKVGNVSEQVSVEANAALVETQATGVGTVMENQRILELPLNGRVATDLIQLTGAVIPQGSAGNGGFPNTQQFVIAGGQAFGVAFYLDGSVFNNPWDLANMPLPFPDALQEFKVETSTLTASNGIHAGGTITGVTRSGSNVYHGDAFDFFRNGDMNARNALQPTRDTLKRNQFGGVFGGPVKKDKLFFFFGYQGTRVRQDPAANTAATFVPTAAMIAGDFTACPADVTGLSAAVKALFIPGTSMFPQSILDPAAHNLAVKLPPPTTTNPCGNTSYSTITQVDEDQFVGRGDYQTSQKNSLFGRYIRDHYFRPPAQTFSPGNLLTSTAGALNDADQGWVFGDTYLISPTFVNQFRASVDRIGIHRYDLDYVSACDLGVQNLYCGYVPHQSGFAVTNGFNVGPGTGGQAVSHTTPIQINDDISWIKGSHQINFGVGGEVSKMLFDGNVYSQTNWTFPNMASFLLGEFSSNSLSLPNNLNLEKWFVNAYIQDTWKLSPHFTVNAGLRWEPFLPPTNISGSVYDFSVAALAAGTKTSQFVNAPPGLTFPGDPGFNGKKGENDEWALFAPRLAIAWDPWGDGKTVVRASWGISYDYNSGELMVNAADAPPYGGTEIWSGGLDGFSNPYLSNPGGNIFPYTPGKNSPFAAGGVYIALQPNMKTTAVNQWNLTIQHQFGKDWLVSAQYIGSESAHLWDSYQLNPAVYISGNCPAGQYGLAVAGACSTTANQNYRRAFVLANYPGTILPTGTPAFGYVDLFDDGGTASYNGLLLGVQKRISKGLAIQANFTWSHCIGDLNIGDATGNAGAGYIIPGNRRLDRSNCQSNEIGGTFSADRRFIFNSSVVYHTPRLGAAWATRLMSNWVLTGLYHATSAYWLTVTLPTDVALTGATVERPNQVLPNPLCSTPTPSCWINPLAFSSPTLGTFGNLGKNSIPGPANWQIDLSIAKEFTLHENHKLEFRVEAFNLTNSFRAGIPQAAGAAGLAAGGSGVSTVYGTSTFGTITSALDPRIMQLALKYSF